MVIGEPDSSTTSRMARRPGVAQEKIDNIMSGISNTGIVKMNNHRKKLRQRFDLIKKLGQGTYGKVQLGINKETGQEVAIKTIKKCKIEAEADLVRIRREVQIMSSVQHPNIIHIYEVFENREKMVLVMEFAAGGELYDYLSERKVLSEDEARRIFRQVSTAVYYCHKHKICHRDLKLENILLDENGNAKIADFGLSNVFDEKRLLATFCGSPLYASPEIVKGTPYQGPEVDCWSLGVLLYTLVYGAMPFDGSNFKRLVKQISLGDYYEPKNPSSASPLIREMLTVCPQRRANIEQICSHWWVNEGYKESCLDLAEDLANQTPVRLDVLLSLSPASVTADQLVIPSADEAKSNERVARSHSVGSIRDIGNTEAERRILDMVAAGGEAALMPSPTRTITPATSPVQIKRKLQNTLSIDHVTGGSKKKEKPTIGSEMSKQSLAEMEVEQQFDELNISEPVIYLVQDLEAVGNDCNELIEKTAVLKEKPIERQMTKMHSLNEIEEINPDISSTKIIKKFANKHKTADLAAAISEMLPDEIQEMQKSRKNSLPDENLGKTSERRRSRILETAEKFQNMSNLNKDKPKKIVIPGVSVGNFKKEFERKASLTSGSITPSDRYLLRNNVDQLPEIQKCSIEKCDDKISIDLNTSAPPNKIESSASRNSLVNFSLEEARRSMENSIALLNKARNESSEEVDELCAKTQFKVTKAITEREKKLRSAREIIGNAIQPGGRLCLGVRKPPVPFGANGRSISEGIMSPKEYEKKTVSVQIAKELEEVSNPEQSKQSPVSKVSIHNTADISKSPTSMKTSRAEITLKSATLPRRKGTKGGIQLDIKPKIVEQPMRFSTEMQHQMPDLRSAPIGESLAPYSSTYTPTQRATSLDPQMKEHIIPIQRSSYIRSSSNAIRSGSLSRQSTIESDTDTNTTNSQICIPGSSQPIRKSPREFIIPIAVEGGGYVTPRAGSLEPSESNTSTINSRSAREKHVALLTEVDTEEDSPFQKLRISSIHQDGDTEEPQFTMHRLRSTRPIKKLSQESNDSQSSGEDDDEDGFEILTAENLFSTLLQRVRALTNRLNLNNDISSAFPNSRLIGNIRQPQSPFWNQEPFASRLNNPGSSWRHSLSRDLGSDIDSMFSRTGATLPRGKKINIRQESGTYSNDFEVQMKDEPLDLADLDLSRLRLTKDDLKTLSTIAPGLPKFEVQMKDEPLDLADLDLSRLRLTKDDLKTLSTITPGLPKYYQDQLLAKLPPTQARKLSRTLSIQNNSQITPLRMYKRSLSEERDTIPMNEDEFHLYDHYKQIDALSKRHTFNNCPEDPVDQSLLSYRNSNSHGKSKINSANMCKTLHNHGRSSCSLYSSDVSDKYKYYSPNLGTKNVLERAQQLFYHTCTKSPCTSPVRDLYGRPPSGCLSPPPVTRDNSLRKHQSQRRISRFLRADFFETHRDESILVREKRLREREAQNVLKEIREKSRERIRNQSIERLVYTENNSANKPNKGSYLELNNCINSTNVGVNLHHIGNESSVKFLVGSDIENDKNMQRRRRTLFGSNEINDEDLNNRKNNFISNHIFEHQNICLNEHNMGQSRDSNQIDEIMHEKYKVKIITKKAETKLQTPKAIERTTNKKITKLSKKENKVESKYIPNITKQNSVENVNFSAAPIMTELKKNKSESKLMRPKSYPSKDPNKYSVGSVSTGIVRNCRQKELGNVDECDQIEIIRMIRPKSYCHFKLTPPKDVRESYRGESVFSVTMKKQTVNNALINTTEKITPDNVKSLRNKSKSSEEKQLLTEENDSALIKSNDNVVSVKPIEVAKKLTSSSPSTASGRSHTKDRKDCKNKSPEKKIGKGFLHTIGQKLEKLRENTKNKEKKAPLVDTTEHNLLTEKSLQVKTLKDQNKSEESIVKVDKKSRIDAMIRSLRDRSIPRASVMTESGLIKRAVSVEDISGSFNKRNVSKVLGLFKKIEKDDNEPTILNTRSTSNLEKHISITLNDKSRPKSIGFIKKNRKANTNAVTKRENETPLDNTIENKPSIAKIMMEEKMRGQEFCKDKRRILLTDFSELENEGNVTQDTKNENYVSNRLDIRSKNFYNNNNFCGIIDEINQNRLITPCNEIPPYCSSDSKSLHDECASSSTFLSPSDEADTCFDNWSVCSEDNYIGATPSPTVSRISRTPQFSSPKNYEGRHDSVVDRIRRRSFYSRFNEKKPKRHSNIVGPAARDYYRESAAKLRSRPPDKVILPDIEIIQNPLECSKPLKLSSASNDLEIPCTQLKSNPVYTKSRSKNMNDISQISSIKKSYIDIDYIRPRNCNFESNNSNYTALDPKCRSSFTSNGIASRLTARKIDGYATFGRRIRPYDHTSTLLDLSNNTAATPVDSLKQDQLAPTESNLNISTTTIARSPTNI